MPIDPQNILSRLSAVSIADAAAIRRALSTLPTNPREAELAPLIKRLELAEQRTKARAASVPTPRFDQDLPVIARRHDIARAIRDHQVVIVAGATGSGKTTQLPQICLSLGLGVRGTIAHTQPRRLAARAVASRIAHELNVNLGEEVGFKVRFNDRSGPRTLINLVTDGVLLAEATGDSGDPLLLAYDTIIIDEAHERSLNIDFLLGYLKNLLPKRPDLKLIITSATIDPRRFSDHFGGPSVAPVITVEGRTFPVELRYLPGDERDFLSGQVDNTLIVDAVGELCSPKLPMGDILVFLPGEREIRAAARAVQAAGFSSADVLPLYSRLSESEQDRVFSPSPPGRRKIVLSTNVAETSLTVPGIRYVVDAGLVRLDRYDPKRKVSCLPIEPVSIASADQRAGRCGRVAEGVCIRLYDEAHLRARPRFTDPEILRTDLASVLLRCKSLNLGPVESFPFIDPPAPASVRDGLDTLFELHALDSRDQAAPLTPVGRRLATLPVDPRVGRMLIESADRNCLPELLVLAAALESQDPLQRPPAMQAQADAAHASFKSESSDFTTLLNLWRLYHEYARGDDADSPGPARWCREHFVSIARMREWTDLFFQLAGAARDAGLLSKSQPLDPSAIPHASPEALHRSLLAGLLTSVCCRDDAADSFQYRAVRGNLVHIFPGSGLFKKRPKWILAAELVQTTKLYARTVAPIDPSWIVEAAPHMLDANVEGPHIDPETSEPSCFQTLKLAGLTVQPRRRVNLSQADPAAARALLIDKLLIDNQHPSPLDFVRHNADVLSQAEQLRARLRSTDELIDRAALFTRFDAIIPKPVASRADLDRWYVSLRRENPAAPDPLRFTLQQAVRPAAHAALDSALFPDQLTLASSSDEFLCPLTYRLAPGKDSDGVTARLPLLALPLIAPHRCSWGVPGWLTESIASLIKQLPRAERSSLETAWQSSAADSTISEKDRPRRIASDLAGLVSFAESPLPEALSEAVEIALSVTIPPALWPISALSDYLLLRLEVTDHKGQVIAHGRDAKALQTRLAQRIERAQAVAQRKAFARSNIKSWDFPDLPDSVARQSDHADAIDEENEQALGPDDPRSTAASSAPSAIAYPALIDQRTHVNLTLEADQSRAEAITRLGVRRLFVLSARDELLLRIDALPNITEIERWFSSGGGSGGGLGTPGDLRDDLMCITCERVFLAGQAPIRTREAFELRKETGWGRLGQTLIDTATLVAKVLEPRFLVAKRLSSGTNRLWAASIADIREHAAYLMPQGFLHTLPWERLQRYPLYAQAMRQRLLNLREDGSGAESDALAQLAPYHKRFTAYVARQLAIRQEEAAAALAEGDHTASIKSTANLARAVPASRRAAPTVNLDAGHYSLQPGSLSPAAEAYRWALEEFRVALFAPALLGSPEAAAKASDRKKLDELAKKLDEPGAKANTIRRENAPRAIKSP